MRACLYLNTSFLNAFLCSKCYDCNFTAHIIMFGTELMFAAQQPESQITP